MRAPIALTIVVACLASTTLRVRAQPQSPDLEERVRRLEAFMLEQSTEPEPPEDLRFYWDRAPRMETRDQSIKLRLRARIQTDFAGFFGEDDVNDGLAADADEDEAPDEIENGGELRRARLGIQGQLYEDIEFKIVYDFADGDAEPKDVYIGLAGLPVVGTLRLGHQREPFSRVQGSSRNYVFMEKGLQNALSISRNIGVRALQAVLDERATWSAGAYFITDDSGGSLEEDAFSLTARVSGLPLYDKGRDRLVHLGAAYSYRQPDEAGVDFGERPEAHLSEKLVGREDIPADTVSRVGTEAALRLGPFMVQSEWIVADVDLDEGSNATFLGYFVSASYFLTGEVHPYHTFEGNFGTVRPRRNFSLRRGDPGAWEIAARVSGVDLNDGAVEQGELRNLSAALNWYLNPTARVMVNYVYADAEDLGDVHILQGRFQLDF